MANFTAPTYMQSDSTTTSPADDSSNGSALDQTINWFQQHFGKSSSTSNVSAPSSNPQTQQDVVSKLNLPAGWKVVGAADGQWKDPKSGQTYGQGTHIVYLTGPTGQPGTVSVDDSGNVTEPLTVGTAPDAGASKDTVPSPPDQWVSITDGNGNVIGRQDPKTGVKIDITPRAQPAKASPPTDQYNPDGTLNPNYVKPKDVVASPSSTAKYNPDGTLNQNYVDPGQITPKDQATLDQQKRVTDLQAQNDAANQALAAAKLKYDQDTAAADQKFKQAQLDSANDNAAQQRALDQYKTDIQNAHDKASEAQAAADLAEKHLVDEQNAQYQKGTLANQTAQTAETARHNQVTEGQTATTQQDAQANMLLNAQRDAQTAAQQAGTMGAGLLNSRVTAGTGMVNNILGRADNAHLGLGSQLPSGWGASMLNGVQNYVTGLGGGPDVYAQAAAMVKNANPAVANSASGQQVTAQLADMLNKYRQMTGQDHPAGPAAIATQAPGLTAPDASAAPPAPVVGAPTMAPSPVVSGYGTTGYQGADNPNIFGSAPDSVPFISPAAQ